MFGRREAEISHQLPRMVETMKVSNLGHHRYSHDECNTAHRLDSFHHWGKTPSWNKRRNLASQSFNPRLRNIDGIQIVLEHDLLRRMLEAESAQPSSVGDRPAPLARIDPAVAEQKALQVLSCPAENPHRRRSCPNKIAHRFVCGVWNPDCR